MQRSSTRESVTLLLGRRERTAAPFGYVRALVGAPVPAATAAAAVCCRCSNSASPSHALMILASHALRRYLQ
jgi:hypothetical protein